MRSASVMMMVVVMVVVVSTHVNGDPNSQKLSHDMFLRNPLRVRPVSDNRNNLTVFVGLAPLRLRLDDQKQEMIMDAWIFMSWTDAYLVWDRQDYAGLDQIQLDATKDIWIPDMAFFNMAGDVSTPHFGNVPVIVHSTGSVLWFPPTNVKVPCNLNLRRWPDDRHNCTVNLGSWTHHGEQVDLKIMENGTGIVMENFEASTNWKLVGKWAERRQLVQADTRHVDLVYTFSLQRLSGGRAGYMSVTAIVMIVLIMSSYCVPATNLMPRLLLHVSSMSIVVACYFVLFSSLPSSGGPVPNVVKYYCISLVLSCGSVGATVFIYYMTSRSQSKNNFWSQINSNNTTVQYRHLQNYNIEPVPDHDPLTFVTVGEAAPHSSNQRGDGDVIGNTSQPSSGAKSLLEQTRIERQVQQREKRIRMINIVLGVIVTFAFTINFIVLILD